MVIDCKKFIEENDSDVTYNRLIPWRSFGVDSTKNDVIVIYPGICVTNRCNTGKQDCPQYKGKFYAVIITFFYFCRQNST